jgi:hydrogenase/urease accessory protein HupE
MGHCVIMRIKLWKRFTLIMVAAATCFCLTLVAGLTAQPGLAHWADLSTAEIDVADRTVHLTLALPTELLTTLDSAALGDNRNPDPPKIIPAHLRMTNLGQAPDQVTVVALASDIGSTQSAISGTTHRSYDVNYIWSTPIQSLKIEYGLFAPGVSTAQCVATIMQGDRTQQFVFTPQRPNFALSTQNVWQQSSNFVLLGIEHILSGYDHILFVVSVILTRQQLRDLIKTVTAFTVAHSFTLALSVLNIVTLPSVFVESAIALSIIYMAYANLRQDSSKHRSILTFGFGLLHGLGFASILRGIDLAPQDLILSLASFNIGVEVGQLAIVVFVLMLLRQLERLGWSQRFIKGASLMIIGIGSYWFVQRAFGI